MNIRTFRLASFRRLTFVCLAALMLGSITRGPHVLQAASLDTIADRVFGQPDFNSPIGNSGGVSANSLAGPLSVTLDSADNLFIADMSNNRVLEYDTPLTTDTTADRVFGQPDFTSSTPDNGGVGASGLHWPTGVAVDGVGRLFVVDAGNNRVLEYDLSNANPLPTIAGLSQNEALAGSVGFTLTITGTNFVARSVVRWNGADRPTTVVSSTRLMAEISAADLAAAGAASISVFNPAPGGGSSSAQMFTIRPKYLVYLPLVAR